MRRLILSLFVLPMAVAAVADESKEPSWDVSAPAYSVAAQSIDLDVTTGTWMSLDVSPDGSKIVFDMLGDLYLLDIAGGDAQNISAGFHWDMQPRFSPNGEHIAFTSDRDGGDNIWVMGSDGSEPRALTSEKFRLLNNPTWSPDSQHIAARKHFTTARSLGTGEIWLYDLRGGDGVAVVERPSPSYQKELGEPLFAPDGESIYYTQNATPGDTFIYAQDTNKEIFRIREVELATGEIRNVVGGPGGAVRPTPSPDGRWMAYVKRVRAQSRLFVMDLETGDERMLVDQLDQDMQETWAVHGVYPNMDWLPDSSAIVFWRNGKIEQVDLDSGVVSTIPFRVRDTREVYAAPKFKVDVAPETFNAQMVRWAQRVPGSDTIVFESLGRLWTKTGGGEPKRLTRDRNDAFETYPVVAPNGRNVYFIAWNDETLGEIRRVSVRGGSSRVISEERLHYRELAISPDGDTLAVRLARGGNLLKPRFAHRTGIYTLPAAGGDLSLVTDAGAEPQFPGRNDRLSVVRSHRDGANVVRKLTSMRLDGMDERDLAQWTRAREIAIAPDGRHVAFIEGYHVFVAALPRTGKMLTLGPSASSVPLQKLSIIGGEHVGWQDSETVTWSIGPTFKQVSVAAAFGEDFEAPTEGVDLSVTATTAKPDSRIAFTNARVVSMDDAGVIDNATVLIEGNRIRALGASIDIPADFETVDLAGKTVVPGFIDIHGHGPYGQDLIVPQQNWSTLAHLALGVTTIHDPSSRASLVFPAAEYARAGLILSPRIYSTGEIVYGAKASVYAEINSYDDALAHVKRLKAQGAISVKNYNQPRREQRQQVVEAARQEKLMVVAEGGALYHMDLNLVADGNTGVEHTLPQLAIYDDVVQFWSQTDVGYTPTLGVGYGTINGEDYWYQHDDVWKHPILSEWVPPSELQPRSVRRQKAPESDYMHAKNAAIGKQLADAGVLVNIGGHGQREGLATHWELWMFVQGGMTPLEALQAATIAPARYMGLDADLGSITPGKLADLVVIDGDVLTDIRQSDNVTHVMLNGRLFATPSMTEIVSGDAQPRPRYWQGRPESAIR